jgi:putative ABC transport system permease protein
MTPATADRLKAPWQNTGGVLTGVAPLSRDQEDRLEEALGPIGAISSETLYTERGFTETFTIPLIALIVAAVLAVLIGTLTATGLTLADARPDFATLSAVGAGPRTRRLMAGAHALTIALLGSLAGIAVGFVPGLAVTWPLTSDQYSGAPRSGPVIDVPWLLLLGMAAVVPLFAALMMAATTRSRLPLVRRLGE